MNNSLKGEDALESAIAHPFEEVASPAGDEDSQTQRKHHRSGGPTSTPSSLPGAWHKTDANETSSSNQVGSKLFFAIGFFLGLILGPFSFLLLICCDTTFQDNSKRKGFMFGAPLGMILTLIGLAIAFSVNKFHAI